MFTGRPVALTASITRGRVENSLLTRDRAVFALTHTRETSMNGRLFSVSPDEAVDGDRELPLNAQVSGLIGRRIRDLRIEIRAEGLILRGRANSYHAKQLAQHALLAVTDLPLAANQIEVACLQRVLPGHVGQVKENGMPSPMKPCVLIATGDDRLRSSGHNYLTRHGFVVFTAQGGVECVTLLRELNPDVIVLDTDLLWGGADGVLALIRLRNNAQIPVVLLFWRDAVSHRGVSPIAPPVVSGLEKPVALESLLEAVRFAAGEDDASPRA